MEKKPTKIQLLQFNLIILKQEHRDKGPAAKGYKKLHAAIAGKKDKFLFQVLRHHSETPDGVYLIKEIDFRHETDYLIKFYSLLEIAMMAGYVPGKLPDDLRAEIIEVLGHPAVKKYYTEHYPLLLPQVVLEVAQKNKPQKPVGTPALFRELLVLDYKEDDDIGAFLDLLDGFIYNGKNIHDFNKLLSNKKEQAALLAKQRKNQTLYEKAFWGFVKYNDYLKLYEELLKKCDNETFRSAVWHFRGYWFANMKALMKDEYLKGLENIKELAAKTTEKQYERNFKTGSNTRDKATGQVFDYKKNYEEWKKEYKKEVSAAQKSVAYNLNSKHSKALKSYLKSL